MPLLWNLIQAQTGYGYQRSLRVLLFVAAANHFLLHFCHWPILARLFAVLTHHFTPSFAIIAIILVLHSNAIREKLCDYLIDAIQRAVSP